MTIIEALRATIESITDWTESKFVTQKIAGTLDDLNTRNKTSLVAAINEALAGGGGVGAPAVKISSIELLASKWLGSESPYYQFVDIDGATEYSKIDLQPSIEQLAVFHNKDLAFVAENDDGIVVVYSLGDKPENDYVIQVSITEVNV